MYLSLHLEIWPHMTTYRVDDTFNRIHCLFQELISCMLEVDVEDRFSADDVLEHPWVAVSMECGYVVLKK